MAWWRVRIPVKSTSIYPRDNVVGLAKIKINPVSFYDVTYFVRFNQYVSVSLTPE
jgi:hypothetical protein